MVRCPRTFSSPTSRTSPEASSSFTDWFGVVFCIWSFRYAPELPPRLSRSSYAYLIQCLPPACSAKVSPILA